MGIISKWKELSFADSRMNGKCGRYFQFDCTMIHIFVISEL